MSDFLTSLAARSFGAAPAIRPRIASLFEPIREDLAPSRNPAASGTEEAFSFLENDPDAQGPQKRKAEEYVARLSPESDERGTARHIRQPQRAIVAARGVAGDDAIRPIARLSAKHDEQGTAQTADEQPAQSRVVPSLRNVRELQRVVAADRAVESDDGTVVQESPIRHSASDRPLVAGATRQGLETGRVKDPSLHPDVSLAHPQAAENAERGLVVPPKIPAEMRLSDLALSARTSRQLRENAQRRPSEPPPSEPSVQVTIGRIEIRATKENARPTRPASSSPVMSLEEYLRGRVRRGGQ